MNRESNQRREHRPERRGGQGLDPHQYDSGDATILALLAETPAAEFVDLAITWRANENAYEVWSRRGMIRFKRFADDHGALSFEVVEQLGENPIANQDPFIVSTIDEELDAAARSGNPTDDPNRAYFEPRVISHPYAYERIAQLFDSPRAPDLIVSPKAYAYGIQPGQHGALDVVQCRAPLVFSGPGVRRGTFKLNARQVDVAPTIARIAGLPKISGLDASGSPAEVYLKRQDGRPLDEIIDDNAERPKRVYMFLLDGLSHSELRHQLDNNRAGDSESRGPGRARRDSLARLDRQLPEHHVAQPLDDSHRRMVRASRRRQSDVPSARASRDRADPGQHLRNRALPESRRRDALRGVQTRRRRGRRSQRRFTNRRGVAPITRYSSGGSSATRHASRR